MAAWPIAARVPLAGYSTERIGYCVVLTEDGSPAFDPVPFFEGEGKKRVARPKSVPQPTKRTSGIAPNFLWDKTSYALGVTAGEGRRTADEHSAFVARHEKLLAGADDLGLQALLAFLGRWRPEQFDALGWPAEMKDQNIVFALENEYRQRMIHDRPAARELWSKLSAGGAGDEAVCLVTGERAPVARLHPAIKGVWGAQSSGASIVSFNLDAFTSYGHEQGDNAPVSEHSAFAYTTALNKFLEKGSRNRIQIGDASTVFWADALNAELAEEAEGLFGAMLGGVDESAQASKVGEVLEKIRAGRPLSDKDVAPELAKGVRFYVLGLSPNAARLSMRFYMEDDFGVIAERFQRHGTAMRIDPPPKDANPSIWRCLIETAAQRKSDNILPQLAGEWLRAILTGSAYPLTLLATILMRLRADKDVNPLRVAMLKATLISAKLAPRDPKSGKREVPVSLDPQNKDPGYLLGRLFAAYEYAQTQALPGVNATIRDKYYGTASATPRAIFPLLQRGSTHHLAKLRKDKPGFAINIDRKIADIYDLAEADKLFVPTLTAQKQAMFAVGYYHQRNDFYRRKDAAVEPDTATASEGTTQ
jgi:CRISPR-associated protein Csd1